MKCGPLINNKINFKFYESLKKMYTVSWYLCSPNQNMETKILIIPDGPEKTVLKEQMI